MVGRKIRRRLQIAPCAGRCDLRGHVVAPGVFKSFLDGAVNVIGHLRIGKTGEPRVLIGGQGRDRAELARRASAISAAYFGTTMAEALMQLRPPLSEMDDDHQIDKFRPALDFVVADQDFAVARAVDLNGRIVRVGAVVLLSPKISARPHGSQDFPRAFVVGGIKSKRLRPDNPPR